MKKDTLIIMLINVMDSIGYCERYGACEGIRANLEFIINKLKTERIEND